MGRPAHPIRIEDTGEYLRVALTQGLWTLVDYEDRDLVDTISWYALKSRRTFYAVRKPSPKIRLHCEIGKRLFGSLMLTKIFEIDHINKDGLDNRRQNLRIATGAQNRANTQSRTKASSTYLGVHWNRHRRKWHAQIMQKSRKLHIGLFDDEKEAARAYDAKAREIHGAFANPNFLD